MKNKEKLISFYLRFGIGIAFLYVAISSLLNPGIWIGFIPSFLTNIISANIILFIFSIYQILISLWLFSDKKIYFASILSSITLFMIIITNLQYLDIVFRDIPILFSSIALIILYKK